MSTTTAQIVLQAIALLLMLYLAIRVERIKAGISKDLEIHRVQFGREFHVYRYLWEKIAHLNIALNAYSDPLNQTPPDQRLIDLRKQYFEVNETTLNNEPFIKKEIYDQCRLLLQDAAVQVRFVDQNGLVDEEKEKQIVSTISNIKEAIRRYIHN